MTSFRDLGLIEPICRALADAGYDTPTPIQAGSIPTLLAGRDLFGCAQTGTGKTAGFAVPILQHLANAAGGRSAKRTRAVILSPTRELACQIGESLETYSRYLDLTYVVIYGGVGYGPQKKAMSQGVDIIVATPGRLLDLMKQGLVKLDQVTHLVLDEADRMLDMGFIPDVRRIVEALPSERQSMLFSATLPATVKRLAASMLRDPDEVFVAPSASTVESVKQRIMFVDGNQKAALLVKLMKDEAEGIERALVFCRTQHAVDRVVRLLSRQTSLRIDAIHGGLSQQVRERALDAFKQGRTQILVATDVAARGLDIDDISHVFNYDMPSEADSYVHRIGRTARAGASGTAISFCSADEAKNLAAIEYLIGQELAADEEQPFHSFQAKHTCRPAKAAKKSGVGFSRAGGRRGRLPQRLS